MKCSMFRLITKCNLLNFQSFIEQQHINNWNQNDDNVDEITGKQLTLHKSEKLYMRKKTLFVQNIITII